MTDWTREMEEEAITWLIRQRDPSFDDWETFEAWLAADAAHARAYAETSAADRDLDELLAGVSWPAEAEPDFDEPVVPSRRRWLGGALAASVALAVAAGSWLAWPSRDLYSVQTAAGERRTLVLADTKLELNGETRIELDRKDQRFARMERGQVLFTVKHDPTRPFRLETADATLVDAGTTFEVTTGDGALDLAVSEGMVVVDPGKAGIDVPAGQRFTLARGQRTGRLSAIRPADVGTWRSGQLFYDGAPLSRVAADLQRNLGVPVSVGDTVAARPFRGVVRLDGGVEPTMARLNILLGANVRRSGKGWVIAGP
ncbi:FecR family protein [Sphingomonas pruni]|uniref:FecR family protein n=1 Tax=Sphingomonas pruni TaxID=40683 RepID=UPI0008351D5B|nr:FecR domain-containing protein [Sphingomonas pruni]